MTGRMMADAWHQTLENYNVDVPLKLALAQAHLESGFGQSDLSSRKNKKQSVRNLMQY
jgi:flagellum-specific peptidoglycan hydrolase FlgJ